MNTLRDFLDEAWHRLANKPYTPPKPTPSLETIRKEEWVLEFISAMSNRMVFGRFRYGPIATQPLDKYDFVSDMHRRLDLYSQDGNLEHLVDVGNEAMIQFYKGKKYFNQSLISQDDTDHNPKVG